MELLTELRSIIYSYDNLCSCWIDNANANDYCEEMDDLRNRALEIIENLEKRG